jgi:hypothetical protein
VPSNMAIISAINDAANAPRRPAPLWLSQRNPCRLEGPGFRPLSVTLSRGVSPASLRVGL